MLAYLIKVGVIIDTVAVPFSIFVTSRQVRGHNAHGWGHFSCRSDAANLDRRF